MDTEFFKVAGAIVGFAFSGAFITLAVKIGFSWGEVKSDIAATKASSARTETTVGEYGPRIQRIEQTLHGPEGDNGLYSSVRNIERRLGPEVIPNPGRRKTDRKRRAS